MKKLILLVTLLAGCGMSPNGRTEHESCIFDCDKSLNNCVNIIGGENKLVCHKTYEGVCMPGCNKK